MRHKRSTQEPALREESVSELSQDRRQKRRYPMSLPIEFKIVKNYLVIGHGTATSVDLSSNGIAFVSDTPLKVGSYLEVAVNWPVLLSNSCPLKLMIFGKVTRSDGQMTAVAADRHEFRTRKASSAQPTASMPAMAAGFR